MELKVFFVSLIRFDVVDCCYKKKKKLFFEISICFFLNYSGRRQNSEFRFVRRLAR